MVNETEGLGSSEPEVPNRSEPRPDSGGRPANVTDDELFEIGIRIYQRDGHVPRINDIITAAGGAQRARAVQARRQVADAVASGKAREWINTSPAVDLAVRRVLDEFLRISREQVQDRIAAVMSAADTKVLDAQDTVRSLATRVEELTAERQSLRQKLSEIQEAMSACEASLRRCRQDARRYRVQARERKAALDLISEGKR